MRVVRRDAAISVAAAAALVSYALAYAGAVRPLARLLLAAIAIGSVAGARQVRWTRLPASLPRIAARLVHAALALLGLVIVFSRQLPMLSNEAGRRGGAALGGLLALAVLAFLGGGRAFSVFRHLLPAIVGVLAAAGMDPGTPHFRLLAGVAAAAAWTHAFFAGGPRRVGLPLAVCAAAGGALAWGIAWFLPFAQPHVVEYIANAYTEGRTGLSNRSDLGEIESLATSRRLVARVFTERPQLLRMQVFNQFDGRRWATVRRSTRPLARLEAGAARPGALAGVPGQWFAVEPWRTGAVETRVLPALALDDGWGLLTPAHPTLVVWPGDALAQDDLGIVGGDARTTGLYGVANDPAPGTSPPNGDDLELPVRLDPRLLQLAATLAEGARSERESVDRTLGHLQTGYRYTLEVGRFRSADPLAEFLFEKRAGYCEYFATAAAVLLRAQGVATRYVKGVSVRPERLVAGHYVVRESDAHAWVEVYLPGEGWVEADPTPTGGWAATHPEPAPGALAARWEAVQAAWRVAWARFQQGGWPALTSGMAGALRRALDATRREHLLAVGALLALLPLALRIRSGRRRPAAPVAARVASPALAGALQRVEAHWERRGRPRPAARGLIEHLDGLPVGLLDPDSEAVCRRVVLSYYDATFGGLAPSADVLADLDRDARALR
ncbi:MAG: transglutaminaseTgpA domain-containing protein [Vicinamibacteria bacterium]